MSIAAEDVADARVAEAVLSGDVSELEEEPQGTTALRAGHRAGIILQPLRVFAHLEDGSSPEINGDDNLHTMALVEACYLSAKEHRAVELAEIVEGRAS